jgi:hypothetical protein
MLFQTKPVAGKDATVTSGVTIGKTEPGQVGTSRVRASDRFTVDADAFDTTDELVYEVAPRSNWRS